MDQLALFAPPARSYSSLGEYIDERGLTCIGCGKSTATEGVCRDGHVLRCHACDAIEQAT